MFTMLRLDKHKIIIIRVILWSIAAHIFRILVVQHNEYRIHNNDLTPHIYRLLK